MNKIKLPFKTERIVLKKSDMSNFERYDTKRQIRKGQVKDVLSSLKSGRCFSAISVNRKNNKSYMLDGNHRFEAMLQYFEEFSDDEIEVELNIYNIEDDIEEREEFLRLNHIVKPSSDDILQQYSKDCKWFKNFLDNVNYVSVYGDSVTKPLKAKVLLSAYILAKDTNGWKPRVINPEYIVNMMNNFKKSDIDDINEFLDLYVNVFGVFQKNHASIRTTPLTILFRMWYQNKHKFSEQVIMRKFNDILTYIDADGKSTYMLSSKAGGNWALEDFAPKFCDIANVGCSRKLFELE